MSWFHWKEQDIRKKIWNRETIWKHLEHTEVLSLPVERELCRLGEVWCFDSVLHDTVVRKLGKCNLDETAMV